MHNNRINHDVPFNQAFSLQNASLVTTAGVRSDGSFYSPFSDSYNAMNALSATEMKLNSDIESIRASGGYSMPSDNARYDVGATGYTSSVNGPMFPENLGSAAANGGGSEGSLSNFHKDFKWLDRGLTSLRTLSIETRRYMSLHMKISSNAAFNSNYRSISKFHKRINYINTTLTLNATINDFDQMQSGYISTLRFGYRTVGNVSSNVVSYFGLPGAIGSMFIDGIFWEGEYLIDNCFMPWYNQLYNFCSDSSWMYY